ncbi:ribonuclease P protein subunit p29-like [Actinia tenebrosa]|uniref:Ribonuclease P protein subunit p29 n=1 Tax=Actinia tenebrosa TaxID=6105 RepID=A0A6P8I3F6_ACTTE|nr:ribonuclease P protein subunit p29-like [Actinia tenebrosa]
MEKLQDTADRSLYCDLPYNIKHDKERLGLQPLNCSAKDYVESFLEQSIQRNGINSTINETLRRKPLMLDSVKRHKTKQKKTKSMSSKEKREKKIYELAPGNHKYEMYLPLHRLWSEYMQQVLNLQENSKLKVVTPKMLKADYHGCLITVCRSKCPSYVGKTGIVLQETKNVFKIIAKDNKLKVIPKANSVFSFELNGFTFKIYGNHFRFRASERSVRKFKSKPTLDL